MSAERMIPYGRQSISQADIAAVVAVLGSDFLTQGPVVPRFEEAIAGRVRARHGIAANSATSALHLACAALDMGPGDWLWTSPITFLASANCARYCGASVDFVDIDPRTHNLSPAALEEKLQRAEREGRLPKLVVPVHLSGQPADMPAIHALAKRYDFHVVDDASHAIGATQGAGPVGDGRYSEATVFSFHPVKIITTAEGGLLSTQDDALAARLRLLRSHGMTRDPAQMEGEPEGGWYYEQVALGYNYRMTELQAALGLSQLARIDEFLAHRHAIADRYDRLLAHLPLSLPWRDPGAYSALHLYVVRVKDKDRREVFDAMRAQGIGVNVHYIPVHHQPYYRKLGVAYDPMPEAEAYYREAISLPMYAGLTEAQQDEVVAALEQALRA
jgi:UDP-4-amino-4,6-dideoxy-N-acetyl-beta-L-altrosamine transaminase